MANRHPPKCGCDQCQTIARLEAEKGLLTHELELMKFEVSGLIMQRDALRELMSEVIDLLNDGMYDTATKKLEDVLAERGDDEC